MTNSTRIREKNFCINFFGVGWFFVVDWLAYGPCRCSALLLLGSRDLEHPLFVPIGLQSVMTIRAGDHDFCSPHECAYHRHWRWWLELKFKYWSVWVGLRYTVTYVLPSSLMFPQASRKGNLPSCSGLVVNLMLESRPLRWVVNSSTWYSWIMVNVSSTYRPRHCCLAQMSNVIGVYSQRRKRHWFECSIV